MRKVFTLAILLSCGISALQAQPIRKAAYDVLLEVAQEQYQKKDYYSALQKYEEAYDQKEDRVLLPKMAMLYFLVRDYGKAERTFTRYLRRDEKNEYVEDRFYYGKSLKMNGKYEEAVPEFQKFIEGSNNDSLKTLAKVEITGAEMAMATPPSTKGVQIENAGRELNTPFSEYSPVFARSGDLYFASFNTKDVLVVEDSTKTEYYAKIYRAPKTEKGFGKPEALDTKVNHPTYNNVGLSLSPDGNRMFFTRAALQGNEMSEGKIYYSVGGDGAWGAANEVKGVNGDFISKDPAVGELFGKEVLFFAANMPGGKGGFDLYYAPLVSEGVYGDPVNLGDRINTIGDEETPFYQNGTLYFATDGHPGFGGKDLFFTTWNGSEWSEPTNMGNAFNTSVDDVALSLDAEGYKGVLTSNREGGRSVVSKTCCNDIYNFTIPKMVADLVVGVFDDARKPVTGATIELVEVKNNRPGKSNSQTSEKGNRFGFELALETPYKVVVTHPDYFPDSTQLNTAGLKASKTFEHRFYLKARPKPPAEPEFDTITTEKPIVLENILYDFDDDRIKPESEPDLQVVYELMTEYPDMVIELGSHTDNRGNDNYNKDLSQRRAESARRWLIRKGVNRDRIEAKGYGETQPQTVSAKQAAQYPFLKEGDVLTEDYINKLATEDQKEAAHQINRRTEFRIIKGPTSIIIKSARLKKNTTTKSAPNKNSLIQMDTDSLKISDLSSLYGKSPELLKGLPIMHFDKRTVDFGEVKKGEKRTYTYEFTNVGDAPLKIDVVSACECTTAEWTRGEIKPGGKGKIDIIFDSTSKDEGELIEMEVFLEQKEPDTGYPIIERLQYKFELIK